MNHITDSRIAHIHDGFFPKIFDYVENTRDFLEMVLPQELLEQLDLEYLSMNMSREQLREIIEEIKAGIEIMPTVAQEIREEFRQEFIETLVPGDKRYKEEGRAEGRWKPFNYGEFAAIKRESGMQGFKIRFNVVNNKIQSHRTESPNR